MSDRSDVWQATLALMALTTLEAMEPPHGYGIARRIEQIAGDLPSVNYGTVYPARLTLEQEARAWERTTAIVARFFAPREESS